MGGLAGRLCPTREQPPCSIIVFLVLAGALTVFLSSGPNHNIAMFNWGQGEYIIHHLLSALPAVLISKWDFG